MNKETVKMEGANIKQQPQSLSTLSKKGMKQQQHQRIKNTLAHTHIYTCSLTHSLACIQLIQMS